MPKEVVFSDYRHLLFCQERQQAPNIQVETACLNACMHVTFVMERAMIKCLQVLGVAGVQLSGSVRCRRGGSGQPPSTRLVFHSSRLMRAILFANISIRRIYICQHINITRVLPTFNPLEFDHMLSSVQIHSCFVIGHIYQISTN